MTDDVLPLLKVHDYFRGLADEALEDLARESRVVVYPAGAVVHEPTDVRLTVGFVLRGRLKAVRIDARGVESLFRMIERGEQYGMMVGALSEPVPVRVVALETTTVLDLDYERAMDLTVRHPDLRRLWLTTFAGSLRKHFFGPSGRRAPMTLALIHESPATRRAAERLLDRLRELGERLAVFSDSAAWRSLPDVQIRALHVDGQMLSPEEIRRQVAAWHDTSRIVFDVDAGLPVDRTVQLMQFVDRAVYFVPAADGRAAFDRPRTLGVPAAGWRDKTRVAWVLDPGVTAGPVVSDLGDFAARDFKLADPQPGPAWGRSLSAGLERLVHDLRGVRIGVALGGGAARGMAHLGVLNALERAGIVVDMVAGTSAGAMTGVVYAAGLDPDYCAERFAADLRPSWLFRHLPRGNQWYLLHKYRFGHFDPMLRTYLHDWRLEQLAMPCLTVTVDLVGGGSVVRDRGDAVQSILESINLPVLAVPICRDGQALVDGGLVNNVPADVLVAAGCNFVIAVSVTAKLEREFYDIRPGVPSRRRPKPSVVATILRALLVQNYNLNAVGVGPADVVIEPDVTGYDMTAFLRARELAAVGEAAALGQAPTIKRLLARLDPQLFPAT